jgi:SCY1-like protein 1
VSIFTYEIKNGSEAQFELAKASLKRIKTLRHPSVLQYLDSFENDKVIYVATEYVEPLGFYLDKIPSDGRRDLYLAWAIFQITVSHGPSNVDSSPSGTIRAQLTTVLEEYSNCA